MKLVLASTEGSPQTYKMSSLDNDINQHFQDANDVIQQHLNNPYYEQEYKYCETVGIQHPPVRQIIQGPIYDWNETTQQCWPHVVSNVSLSHSVTVESPQFYSILPPQRNGKGRKKLRLYEYLHEALNDPNMGDSIQWTDSASGTFHFISKNKEKLAECWGQRKGNRKTMTYQKMARALRNYSRTGEIIKVRRKLTYQFNPVILQRLGTAQVAGHPSCHPAQEVLLTQQHTSSEQSYYGSMAPDWHSWYGHYPLQEEYDLATSFTSHAVTKV